VINIGDMLQRLTNHYLPSTTHRVRNPDAERAAYSRYSMPFFLHLRSDFAFKTLPQCISEENPDRYPVSITADDYLAGTPARNRAEEVGARGQA
jgi:isopenicillin N synthase-like dioxygenase